MNLWMWIAVLVAVVVAVAAGAWTAFFLWRTRPWAGPRTRYPVVLVHGVLGFDEIRIGGVKHKYFKGIVEHLEELGVKVYRPKLPPVSSVTERAHALVDAVRNLPGKQFNLIAHSMGGLDARYAIAKLGLKRRVASLVTIGTPHRGTPLANLGSALLGENFGLGRLLESAGLDIAAVRDMTTSNMERFNAETGDADGVFYASVAGSVAREDREQVHPLLKPGHAWLNRSEGANDGLVPANSQKWGTLLAEIEADHWAQIGWGSHFAAPPLYEKVLNDLRRRGF